MAIKCPACGRANEGADECGRCGCDLAGLIKISALGQQRLAESRAAMKQGKSAEALSLAMASWQLKKSSAAARLAFMACILLKKFGAASTWYFYATHADANPLLSHKR